MLQMGMKSALLIAGQCRSCKSLGVYSPQTILVFLPYPFLRTCGKKENENTYEEWERRLCGLLQQKEKMFIISY